MQERMKYSDVTGFDEVKMVDDIEEERDVKDDWTEEWRKKWKETKTLTGTNPVRDKGKRGG